MSVNEIIGKDFPIPKLAESYIQVVIPCLVINADTVTFKYGAVGVNKDGNLVVGKSLAFKDRIIINAVYVI